MRDEPVWPTMQNYIALNLLLLLHGFTNSTALNHYSNFVAIQTEIHHRIFNHTKIVCIAAIHNIYFFLQISCNNNFPDK